MKGGKKWHFFLFLQFSLFFKGIFLHFSFFKRRIAVVVFPSFFNFLKGGSLSPPASRSLLSSSSQSRHAGCSSTASRMKDTAHHQDIFATNSLREKEARSTLRNIARSNGRSQEIDVMKMSNKGERYMFLWYPAPGVAREFGVVKSWLVMVGRVGDFWSAVDSGA